MEKANQERIEETKKFTQIGRKFLVKLTESNCKDMDKFEDIINFMVNEATDYQILAMIFEGKLPEETSNPEKEPYLYEKLLKTKDRVLNKLGDK